MKPVRPGDALRLTAKGLADMPWTGEPSIGLVGLGILTWLRDEASPVQTILDSFDEPAQEILDAAQLLVNRGWVEVIDDDRDECGRPNQNYVNPLYREKLGLLHRRNSPASCDEQPRGSIIT